LNFKIDKKVFKNKPGPFKARVFFRAFGAIEASKSSLLFSKLLRYTVFYVTLLKNFILFSTGLFLNRNKNHP